MRRIPPVAALCAATLIPSFAQTPAAPAKPAAPARPKLVLVLVVDQFRGDYVRRFRSGFTGGLDRLLRNGAWLSDAFYEQIPTITCVGHSQLLTGALPSATGIVANEWWDYQHRKWMTCVDDPAHTIVGAPKGSAGSPWKLQVSTVGDELRAAGKAGTIIGIGTKPRAAIMPSGHAADAAYWFESSAGNFVSSTYYMKQLPAWVEAFNARRPMDRWRGKEWGAAKDGAVLNKFDGKTDSAYYSQIAQSPFYDEVVEELAEQTLLNEKLGQDDITDLLTVSFAATDSIGHKWGPDSPQTRDNAARIDRTLGKLLAAVDKSVGLRNVLVVLTADHGVGPTLEAAKKLKLPAERIVIGDLEQKVEAALSARFGAGPWLAYKISDDVVYLDRDKARARGLALADLQRAAADVIATYPFVAQVFTASDLAARRVPGGFAGDAAIRSFHPERSPDITIIAKPYWNASATGAEHGSPYRYDAHVPIFFMGPGIKPGNYPQRASVADIAPTLAWMLDVHPPSGSSGRILTEILAR